MGAHLKSQSLRARQIGQTTTGAVSHTTGRQQGRARVGCAATGIASSCGTFAGKDRLKASGWEDPMVSLKPIH